MRYASSREKIMKTTYLKEYQKYKIAYLPLGTVEWHGNHLPLETDVIVGQELVKRVSSKIPGFVLPGIYLGTYTEKNGLKGMAKYIKKDLQGEVYQTDPKIFFELLKSVIENLDDNFEKIIIITGHGGSMQMKVLNKISNRYKNVICINPFHGLTIRAEHAGVEETSLLWACRHEEVEKSRAIKITVQDDYFKWYGKDPRKEASIKLGEKLLEEKVENSIRTIKEK